MNQTSGVYINGVASAQTIGHWPLSGSPLLPPAQKHDVLLTQTASATALTRPFVRLLSMVSPLSWNYHREIEGRKERRGRGKKGRGATHEESTR